jgi:nitrite reductase/ring-hydroxylating ferredoxin subunit
MISRRHHVQAPGVEGDALARQDLDPTLREPAEAMLDGLDRVCGGEQLVDVGFAEVEGHRGRDSLGRVKPVRIPLSSLDAEGRAVVDLDGTEVAVFLVRGEPHALANSCPHEGNPLCEGEVLGDTLVCAFHGWRFDLATGACLSGEEPARVFPAELDGEEIVVRA